jgi:tRNA dimethylallyltransferase
LIPPAFSNKLIIIVGPTAAGKSQLALFLAQQYDGEIISVDSMQVYRGMDRGTAKPPQEILKKVQHHLIDVTDPGHDFSLGDFVRMAEDVIQDLWRRQKRPVLVGGTGLYLRGLLKGIFDAPGRDEEFRQSLKKIAREKEWPYLHNLLSQIDWECAQKIARNDAQRIMRALELYHRTDRKMSDFIKSEGFREDRYLSIKIGINTDRKRLYQKIKERVDRFFQEGLVDEVKDLLDSGVPPHCNAFKALGYREVILYLKGEVSLEEAVTLVKINTRRYAKRQLTWFRKEQGIQWFAYEKNASEIFDDVDRCVRSHL